MQEEKTRIISNCKIAKDTYRMQLQAAMAKDMLAGQFVHIKIEGCILRRPISICSIEDKDQFVIIYKVVGEGTKTLATLHADAFLDVFGPLGSFYPLHEELEEVLLIGGGVGVPPLYELAKQYRKRNRKVQVVLGFQDAQSVFYEQEFASLGCYVVIATMDGTRGEKGTVMDAIHAQRMTCDFIYSCGPTNMLKAIEAVYSKGYMSFESRMACGIGACMACVAKDKKEADRYHKICKEGPVFPIGKVEY